MYQVERSGVRVFERAVREVDLSAERLRHAAHTLTRTQPAATGEELRGERMTACLSRSAVRGCGRVRVSRCVAAAADFAGLCELVRVQLLLQPLVARHQQLRRHAERHGAAHRTQHTGPACETHRNELNRSHSTRDCGLRVR